MDEEGAAEVKYTQEYNLEPPSSEVCIMSISDWVRIKRNITRIKKPIPWLQIIYSLFFGAFISTALSWVLLINDADLPPYVSPFYLCAAGASLIIGIACVILEFTSKKTEKSDVDRILEDMADVEERNPQLRRHK